jgi:hypothetical protein
LRPAPLKKIADAHSLVESTGLVWSRSADWERTVIVAGDVNDVAPQLGSLE